MIVFMSEPQSITQCFRVSIQFRKKKVISEFKGGNKLQVEGVRGFISFVLMDLNMFEEPLDRVGPCIGKQNAF